MCFVHKHMQNADFGQILSRRASTKSRVTSLPMVRFSQTWYQKMRKTWKKKVMKKRVAISGGRDTVTDFVQGGGGSPPVKIGLNESISFSEYSVLLITDQILSFMIQHTKYNTQTPEFLIFHFFFFYLWPFSLMQTSNILDCYFENKAPFYIRTWSNYCKVCVITNKLQKKPRYFTERGCINF